MKLRILIPTICFMMLNINVFAQEPVKLKADTLIKKLDSLAKKTDSAGTQVNNINKEAYNDVTKLNARTYFVLLLSIYIGLKVMDSILSDDYAYYDNNSSYTLDFPTKTNKT